MCTSIAYQLTLSWRPAPNIHLYHVFFVRAARTAAHLLPFVRFLIYYWE